MKILVIGGSYFYGRVFVMMAQGKHEITVVNRGTYSMEQFGAVQICGNRKEAALWRGVRSDYDVIVDFCAYEKGDIEGVLQNFRGKVRQYVLISTVDVYRRGTGRILGEDASIENRRLPGEAGNYIAGKTAVERELIEQCAARGIEYTILRPAILYGPYNYAPREAFFIEMALRQHLLPRFTDVSGRFQFVYIKDAAEAVFKCLLQERAYGQAFNLCQDEILDYDVFLDTLEGLLAEKVCRVPMTSAEAERKGIALPFALTKEETELYSNEKSKKELGMSYLPFREGMERTCRAFQNVFEVQQKP